MTEFNQITKFFYIFAFCLITRLALGQGHWNLSGTVVASDDVNDGDFDTYYSWGASSLASGAKSASGSILSFSGSVNCGAAVDSNFDWSDSISGGHTTYTSGFVYLDGAAANWWTYTDPEEGEEVPPPDTTTINEEGGFTGIVKVDTYYGYEIPDVDFYLGIAGGGASVSAPGGGGWTQGGTTNGVSGDGPGGDSDLTGDAELVSSSSYAEEEDLPLQGWHYSKWGSEIRFSISFTNQYQVDSSSGYIDLGGPELNAAATANLYLSADNTNGEYTYGDASASASIYGGITWQLSSP